MTGNMTIESIRKHCSRCRHVECVEKGGEVDLRLFVSPMECWNHETEAASALGGEGWRPDHSPVGPR